MKKSNFRAILLATVLPMFGVPAWSQTGGTLSADEQKKIIASLPEARRTVLSGFDSGNHIVKEAAIRMMRYLPRKLAYDPVLALFQDFRSNITTPGFPLFRSTAIETLLKLDPVRTLNLLFANEDSLWGWISPPELFALTGFDAGTRFSNPFYFALGWGGAFEAPLLSRKYLETKDRVFLDRLEFYPYGSEMNPGEFSRLYLDFKEKKLPLDKIIFAMQDRAGVMKGRELGFRSFTLDELLFQAVLYRLRLSPTVVAPGADPENMRLVLDGKAVKKYNLSGFVGHNGENPPPSAVFPSTAMNNALAFFFAGVPKENHFRDFRDTLSLLPIEVQYLCAGIVADSPDSIQRSRCLELLLNREDPNLIKIALRGFLSEPKVPIPDRLTSLLGETGNVSVKAEIIDLFGRQGKGKLSLFMLDFMREGNDPLLRIVAAGNLLAVYGGE